MSVVWMEDLGEGHVDGGFRKIHTDLELVITIEQNKSSFNICNKVKRIE